jgi:hypothetical protein
VAFPGPVIFVAFPGLVIAFQSRADVPELTGSQERWNIGTDDNLTGAGPDRLPNTGEVGLAVRRSRRGRQS